MAEDIFKLKALVKTFFARWIGSPHDTIWSQQHLDKRNNELAYYPKRIRGSANYQHIKEQDFVNHFLMERPGSSGDYLQGSLAIAGKFEDDICMWFCVDADNALAVEAIETKLIPALEARGVEYVFEYSGNGDRCHLWILFDKVGIKFLKVWIEELFEEAGIGIHDKTLSLELYPTHKDKNVIRLPGGLHLRTFKINPVRNPKGEESNDRIFILETFNNLKRLTEEEVKSQIKGKKPQQGGARKSTYRPGSFYYSSLDLPVEKGLPRAIEKIAKNCQAFNRLLKESKEEHLIADKGGMSHDARLYLFNMAVFNDQALNRKGFHTDEGKQWAKEFFDNYRGKPIFRGMTYDQIDWESEKKKDMAMMVPRCSKMQEKFGYCDGCPFKNRSNMRSPRDLYFGRPIIKKMVKELRMVSHDEIRSSTFKTIKSRVLSLAESGSRKKILLASPQGSGKSFLLDDLAVELSRQGKRVLIAVHSGDIAVEHLNRIAQKGSHAFIVGSHRTHFTKYNPGFDCLQYDPIQKVLALGASSRAIVEKYCDRCPLQEQCRYPKQYAEMLEPEHNIVICQHAHFTSPESMHSILKKRFDVLMIDEAFIDKLLVKVKAEEIEWELLEYFDFPWIAPLVSWLKNGGAPDRKLYPRMEELAEVRRMFDDHMAPWRLPEYLRYYNQEHFMEPEIGLHVFYPPPTDQIPLTLMTDATPPVEMLEVVLDDNNIETYGSDEIIDFRRMNKDNQLIQVLDGSVSKTALRGEPQKNFEEQLIEYDYLHLVDILEMIGDLARDKYKDKKILVTTYKDFKEVVEQWLAANYPDIMNRVLVSHMKIGTNEFDGYEVQFLVAGVYHNANQIHRQVYELKLIANYWNRLKDRPQLPNYRWWGVGEGASIERVSEPVRRIHALGKTVGVFEYENFLYQRPQDKYYNLVEKFAISKTQQAIRLRFNDDKLKIIYVFGKFFLPSFLVTDSVLKDDLLGYLFKDN